jgi:hypothetical protein
MALALPCIVLQPISMAGWVRSTYLPFSAERRKQMKAPERELGKPSFWQLVFLQSKVNGGAYRGEQLPRQPWDWPKDTYFQQRLRLAKWYQAPDKGRLN